jgi:hypothetical protein
VSDVLATAHDSFSKQMVNTVNTVTGAAHGNLDRATKMIAETIHDLENTLDGLRPGRN